MDPNIWGPKLWNIIFDICWNLDNSKLNSTQKQSVQLFFASLKYLLPCKYCRSSYVQFYGELDGSPPFNSEQALKWAYDLRNKVNVKLKKQDKPPTFEKVLRRMKTYQSLASQNDVIDVLFILATNYMADVERPEEHKIKKTWFWIMINILPFVLSILPQQQKLSKILMENPAHQQNIKNKDTVMMYLCHISEVFDGNHRTIESMCEKYQHCKNLEQGHNDNNEALHGLAIMSPR